MIEKKQITVNSRNFDGEIKRTWRAGLIEETDDLITLFGEFESEVSHSQLGIIRRGTKSYEIFWKNRWYSIFRFHEPEGNLRNFYCNINHPPAFDGRVLDFIDLDLDILVKTDLTFQILDRDEFEFNCQKHGYSKDLIKKVNVTVEEIKNLIRNRHFPFDRFPRPGKPK